MAGRIKPPTAQMAVLAALRESIITGKLQPGEQVRQDQLAEQFGVSRVPLREALKILEGEGQVRYEPHRGYFVTELSLADLLEVYRIRDILEDEATRLAVPLLTKEDLARMEQALADTEAAAAAEDVIGMTEANRRFHFSLYEAGQMQRLSRMIRILWDATDVYRALYFSGEDNRERVHAEHRDIMAALTARDIPLSIALLNEHRNHAVQALRELLPDESDSSD